MVDIYYWKNKKVYVIEHCSDTFDFLLDILLRN